MSKPNTFLEPEEAYRIVMEAVSPLETETVALSEAAGRVLSEPVVARLDQPRFRKAAVDGYGVRPDQGVRPFTVVGTIAAGDEVDPDAPSELEADQGLRIMTGAVVPAGIERIIRFEYAEEVPPNAADGESLAPRARVAIPEQPTNIALPGENIRAGEPLLGPRRLTASDVGILASQGHGRVPVVRRPEVAIFSTGSELYSPTEEILPPWAIYDSNGYQLAALAKSNLASVHNYGILKDKQAFITRAIRDAVEKSDVVIVSGGVSMGDLDYVPAALADIGATRLFHGLAMKPGKPTLFATLGEKLLFGLPGNPVSTMAQFELFIAPALHALQGLDYRPREGRFPLASPYTRAKADRHELRPGYYRDGLVHQITYQGSGHLSALASADLIFRIDRGVETLSEGDMVYARFIRPDDRLSSNLGNR